MLNGMASLPGAKGDSSKESIPAAITDIGCEREINEDRYAVIDSPAGRAWVVCDGMGGTLGGELAAQLAIDAIRRGLEAREYDSPSEAFRASIEEANRVVVLRRQNPAFSSMGTTAVGALIQEDEVILANAGDSRAYLVRNNEVEQLTVDHTYVQDLVDRGAIDASEALSHPQAHVLTRCIGAETRLEVDWQTFWIWDLPEGQVEDKLLLCSDGLYSLVSDEEIGEHVAKYSPQECCVKLVELAKDRGGYDNITLAILPLNGQLREEKPGRTRERPKKKKAPSGAKNSTVAPRLPWRVRIAIMICLVVLGSLGAAVVMLLKMMNS